MKNHEVSIPTLASTPMLNRFFRFVLPAVAILPCMAGVGLVLASAQSPGAQSPGAQPPPTQSPATPSPATQSPATQSPATQSPTAPGGARKPWLIAHRGASAYAPENTVPAFRLAADQGATFVEFDLRFTKDRQIVCLHDESLERTTDIEEVYPDRFRETATGGDRKRSWLLEDFTLAELQRLDAGSWFDPKFLGTRLPTFVETIDALRGRSGLFIELKSPERYEGIERQVLAELKAKGLDQPGADPRTPVLLQSFTASSLQIFAHTLGTRLPIHFLVSARDALPWMTPDGLVRVKAFATGLSPEKSIVVDHAKAMARARTMGLLVTPYTFRASAVKGFPDVRAEMAHYLGPLGVDGVITDNPDQMPAAAATPIRAWTDRGGD